MHWIRLPNWGRSFTSPTSNSTTSGGRIFRHLYPKCWVQKQEDISCHLQWSLPADQSPHWIQWGWCWFVCKWGTAPNHQRSYLPQLNMFYVSGNLWKFIWRNMFRYGYTKRKQVRQCNVGGLVLFILDSMLIWSFLSKSRPIPSFFVAFIWWCMHTGAMLMEICSSLAMYRV